MPRLARYLCPTCGKQLPGDVLDPAHRPGCDDCGKAAQLWEKVDSILLPPSSAALQPLGPLAPPAPRPAAPAPTPDPVPVTTPLPPATLPLIKLLIAAGAVLAVILVVVV